MTSGGNGMGTSRIPYSGDLNQKLQKIREWSSQYSIAFQGSTERGSFNGKGLAGSYYREGQFIVVTITSVPLLMSEQSVVNKMSGFVR
jgi:hypothetical protein